MDTYKRELNLDQVINHLSCCSSCNQRPQHIIGKLLPCGDMICVECLPLLLEQEYEQVSSNLGIDAAPRQENETHDMGKIVVINRKTNNFHSINDQEDEQLISDSSSESTSALTRQGQNGRLSEAKSESICHNPVFPWHKVPCPRCKMEFRLQDHELSNFQSLDLDAGVLNQVFHLKRICEDNCKILVDNINEDYFCSDCKGWICEACKTAHKENYPDHEAIKGSVHSVRFAETLERCSVHNERIVRFCVDKSCNIPVCQICCTITHSNHRTIPYNEAADLVSSRLGVVRKINARRHEVLKESKSKLIMKLDEEQSRFLIRREQIENRAANLLTKLDSMRIVLCEKWENSLATINSEFIIAELVDKLLKATYGEEKSIPMLVAVDKIFKINKSWLFGSDTAYLLESGGLPIGLVDPMSDLLSKLSNDPAYRTLLTDEIPKNFGSTMSLTLNGSSVEGLKYTLHSHFVSSEIAAYLAKQNEELSQLSVKDLTVMVNSEFVFLVGFYSSSYGWENGILVLCPKGTTGKQFRCKRAFSIRYQKHCFSRIVAFGTKHLLLADSDNRCVVTYTTNGKEVCTYSFSPNEVPRWLYIKQSKLYVSFRHEIKIYKISVVGDVEGIHRLIFVLTKAIRGFEKEFCVLEDAHVSETGEIVARAFPYADPSTRFREDPSFLNFRVFILNEEGRYSSKLSPVSVTEIYGVCRLSPGVDSKGVLLADYNQCCILSVPFSKTKQKTLDMAGVQCLLSPLDGVEKLRSVHVSDIGDIVTIENNDVKIYKCNI